MAVTNNTDMLEEELEYEYSIRLEELNMFEGIVTSSILDASEQGIYRKMLLVMLYAYFEGFCKKALSIYVEYLNATGEQVRDIQDSLVASTLRDSFKLLEDGHHSPVRIRGMKADGDNKIQRFGRRNEFVHDYSNQMQSVINIPDTVVDTESNLKSYVLKIIMYRLAMDYTIVDSMQRDINMLLRRRNSIAHGDLVRGIEESEYCDYKKAAIEVMEKLKSEIINNYKYKKYLKVNGEYSD